MAAPPPKAPPEEDQAWLLTYADTVTLLMAFFVMLVSFSKIDIPLYEKVAAGIKNELGKGTKDFESLTTRLKVDMENIVFSMQADEAVEVAEDDMGIVIELDSSAFFFPGTAQLRDEAYPVLQNMATTAMAPKYEPFFVEIEGHTDDDPISTVQFPSNWELSAGRASTVVRYFSEQGIAPYKMKAVGYAETQPKYPNRDLNGVPIPENQEANRRVAIHVRPMDPDEKEVYYYRRSEESMEAGDFSGGREKKDDQSKEEEAPAN
ncbi:MAG: OmpA family protein [Rhodospirillales bacterium]|jgi:chemotaxis protein MotB|nr:OmpA family protein [Rhodospirillales bacterium]